ncbi:MAG TPA: hypothetical protein VJN95_14020 [Gemmatimonadales bacterium]|nr:hypothetical protein [Gemmatimonadales bacterium]
MPTPRFTLRPGQAILYGGLTVGVIDCAFATIRSAMHGTSFVKLWQGVASGALGARAAEGGVATAALGLVFHFFIATSIVAFYYFLSRRIPLLRRHPFICGPIYGLGVYIFMNFVVIPLSAIGPQPHVLSRMWWGIGIHLVGIGLPAAWFASLVPQDG